MIDIQNPRLADFAAAGGLTPLTQPPAAWTEQELEDLISDAIGDSLDMGWSARDGAKAVLRALATENLVVVPLGAPPSPNPEKDEL